MADRSSGTDHPSIVLIAASARMLAESSRRAALPVMAIDQFGDEDTRAASRRVITAPAEGGGLDSTAVLNALALLDPDRQAKVVLGGGLDSAPHLIQRIGEERTIIGNTPLTHLRLKEAPAFFDLLNELSIPYPDIRWNTENASSEWLLKSSCSEGGKGVRFFAHDQLRSGDYLQRRLAGSTYSVLFLAGNGHQKIIGFNTLRHIAMGDRPFLFAGAANFVRLRPKTLRQVQSYVQKMVCATGIVGLNSLDFMLDPEGQPQILEINPRPSATLALYDEDAPSGLLDAHIRAASGQGLAAMNPPRQFRCFEVALSPRDLTIPRGLSWPDWCRDRPVAGTMVPEGRPFCTVESQATNAHLALKLLRLRMRTLGHRLSGLPHPSPYSYPV